MNAINWEKLWNDFDDWLKERHSNGTWERQKATIERLVEEQAREKYPEIPGFEGTLEALNDLSV